MKKLSIGSWAYIFNQEKPTTDFHEILHKLSHLGYDGVELGSFGVHPTPFSHPTKADRQRLKIALIARARPSPSDFRGRKTFQNWMNSNDRLSRKYSGRR